MARVVAGEPDTLSGGRPGIAVMLIGYAGVAGWRSSLRAVVGRAPGALRTYFADVRIVGEVGDDMHAYLLTGQRQSWDEIWPRLRTLTVS